MPSADEIASFVAERAKESPHVRRVVEDVKLFDGLIEHAGWKRLAEKVRAGRERFFASLAVDIAAGKAIDQRELDYLRGFYKGAEFVIETPAKAESSLEAAARKAWADTQIELAHQAEENSAYLQDPQEGE